MRRENSFGHIFLYILLVLLCVGLVLLVFLNWRANAEQQEQLAAEQAAAETTPTPVPTATPEPTPEPVRSTENITLAFAGDLVSQVQLTSNAEHYDGDTVRYDYSDELADITSILQRADYCGCTFVGTIRDGSDYGNYEMAPDIGAALSVTGFQMISTATDHILDRGLDGVQETVDTLRGDGLIVVGASSEAGEDSYYIQTINGINVAFLSYTCGTGGQSAAEYSWAVNILTTDYMTDQDSIDKDRVTADIAAAREAGADIVVCYVYWWEDNQYYTTVRDNESELAQYLCENGVDILIGGGIKMPQPIETMTVDRADGTRANCVVCYSLSNLMSCFTDDDTELGAIAMIDISRDIDTDEVWVSGVSYEPLFMLNTERYPATKTEEDDGQSEDGEDTEAAEEEDGEEDLTPVEYTLSVLDARAAAEDYEDGDQWLTNTAFDAVSRGILRLQEIMGEQYDSINGGVTLDYPG